MTTTLQNIQDRAVGYSSANGLASLVSDTSEIINRIAGFERSIYDLATRENRHFFAVAMAAASTGGSSGRSIDLSALTTPVARLLRFLLSDGRDCNQVDIQDLNAELAPRYYVLGKTLYEVGNDWSSASGAVSATLYYVQAPAVLSVTGDLAQTVTLPDEFCDLLEMQLAEYLAHKDVGRDPAELARLEVMISAREADFVSHITNYGGVEARHFNIPAQGQKK